MNRSVILGLGQGSLSDGFPEVTAQVLSYGAIELQLRGSLPADPEILELYNRWQLLYESFYRFRSWRSRNSQESIVNNLGIEIEESGITHFAETDFQELNQRLNRCLNLWLQSEGFRPLNEGLRTELSKTEEIRMILETKDERLQKLPWHFWQFFEDYQLAEFALSSPQYRRPTKLTPHPRQGRARILVILGNRDKIDIDTDRFLLAQLQQSNAILELLIEPDQRQINNYLWQQSWDMLFFAGHSSSAERGRIYVNATEYLTVDDLKYGLRQAIARGLKLAIFNSCDGLGLARDLADLHIPQVIVMREAVPDQVAQTFLKHFLSSFSAGRSLYASVRTAREQLHGLESEFPCATWLPVIYQNPTVPPLTWEDLGGISNNSEGRAFLTQWQTLGVMLAVSLIVTLLIVGVRSLGVMESPELWAYDRMMQLQALLPAPQTDPKIVLVTVNDEDVQKFKKPLSDQTVYELLKKLEKYHPKVIGLDIYRDYEQREGWENLTQHLQYKDQVIALCRVGENKGLTAIDPPPNVPVERLGFADALMLDPGDIIRRYVIVMDLRTSSSCQTPNSFAFQVVRSFLPSQTKYDYELGEGVFIDSIKFPTLKPDSGGYHRPVSEMLGYQSLIHYRPLNKIASQVSLTEVLTAEPSDSKLSKLIKDKIVLIGYVGNNTKDKHSTPLGSSYGVGIHAQIVSQMLDIVADLRQPIAPRSKSDEVFWIFIWSMAGTLLGLGGNSKQRSRVNQIFASFLVGLTCFVLFTQGIWLPAASSFIVLIIAFQSFKALISAIKKLTGYDIHPELFSIKLEKLKRSVTKLYQFKRQRAINVKSVFFFIFLGSIFSGSPLFIVTPVIALALARILGIVYFKRSELFQNKLE